jgi:hypothetical protein
MRRNERLCGRYSLRWGGASSGGGGRTLLGHTRSLGLTAARFSWCDPHR